MLVDASKGDQVLEAQENPATLDWETHAAYLLWLKYLSSFSLCAYDLPKSNEMKRPKEASSKNFPPTGISPSPRTCTSLSWRTDLHIACRHCLSKLTSWAVLHEVLGHSLCTAWKNIEDLGFGRTTKRLLCRGFGLVSSRRRRASRTFWKYVYII